jgi:hypothetical protein
VPPGCIGIEDVKPGDRLIVTEGDSSDEVSGLEGQRCVGDREVASPHDIGVSAILIDTSEPDNVSPCLAVSVDVASGVALIP